MIEDRAWISKIINISHDTPEVKTFTLEIPQDVTFKFLPGQHIDISFHDISKEQSKDEWKGFSISSSPMEDKFINITVLNRGPFSQKMHELQTGTFLRVKGPHGNFIFDEDVEENPVFIAGGAGIAPIMSMIRYIIDTKLSYQATLIYSARNIKNILFYQELKKIQSENDNIKCVFTLTQSGETDWKGSTDRINEEMVVANIKNFPDNIYYICGPYEMMLMISYILQKRGVKNSRIKTELW